MTVCENAQKENEDQNNNAHVNNLQNTRPTSNSFEKGLEPGDVIWAKVSHTSFWWPAVVISDSQSTSEKDNAINEITSKQKQYHVSTLGASEDPLEFHWVKPTQVVKYKSSYDYQALSTKSHKLRNENESTVIPKELRQRWRRANIDAIELKSTLDLKCRLEKFKGGFKQRRYALPEEAVKTLHFERKTDQALPWRCRKNCSLIRALRHVRKRKYGDLNSDSADSSADESLQCPSPSVRSEVSDDYRNQTSETETVLSDNSLLERKKAKRKLKSLSTDLAPQETTSTLEVLSKDPEMLENETKKRAKFRWRERSVLASYEWSDFIKEPSSYKNCVCRLCETKGDLLLCKTCVSFYHRSCYSLTYPKKTIGDAISFMCLDCQESSVACFSCDEYITDLTHESVKLCLVKFCQKAYHEKCIQKYKVKLDKDLEDAPSEKSSKFVCPRHACASCYTSDPHDSNFSQGKFIKCHRCPLAYHTNNDDICIPAGSNILSSTYLVCPLHFPSSSVKKINVNWCFFCSSGGDLVCCEYCPAAFHRSCLPEDEEIPDANHWLCENCRCGSFPKYGDTVWAKLGLYRWWPANISWPWSIPNSVMRAPNHMGQYVVEFFGTHNFSWLPGDRVFLFEEDDEKKTKVATSLGLNKSFEIGMKEQSFEFVDQRFSELAATQNFFSDFTNGSN